MSFKDDELNRARLHSDVLRNLQKKGYIGTIIEALRRLLLALGGSYTSTDDTDVVLVNKVAELAENGSISSSVISGGVPGKNIWYATCSTAAGTGAKTATSSTGDFVLQTGAMVRLKCTTANTASNPTISIDGSTAKTIQPKSGTSGMAYRWRAQEVIDLVYDGSNFIMSLGPEADTSFYGITKLNSATNSTSTAEAATPSAVKSAYDLAASKVDAAGAAAAAPVQSVNGQTGTVTIATLPDPVTVPKGGTGGTDVASARENLGLPYYELPSGGGTLTFNTENGTRFLVFTASGNATYKGMYIVNTPNAGGTLTVSAVLDATSVTVTPGSNTLTVSMNAAGFVGLLVFGGSVTKV